MRWIYALFLVSIIFLAGCSSKTAEPKQLDELEQEDVKDAQGEPTAEVDDAVEETDDAVENAQEIIDDLPVVEDKISDVFCRPGDTYKYSSSDGDVDAIVLGLENYKGKEFCKANSVTVIPTQMGDIDSDTIYYYNEDASEMWVLTTTSSEFMPQPQTNEVHIVDGKVVQ
ncbi:MAG: hypothetical protein NDI94_05935 [Candidatus Woesearchaeota archaeon]|nr:hypothetical protein [Candidatus Woesearchaeota archaeon]